MRAALIISLATLAACGGDDRTPRPCPTGERCSDETPYGLEFSSVGDFVGGERNYYGTGEIFLATGGTDKLGIFDEGVAFERDFAADDAAGSVLVTDRNDTSVEVTGAREGSNYLRVLAAGSDKLFDRVKIYSVPIGDVTLASTAGEVVTPGMPVAFVPGSEIEVQLHGNVDVGYGPTYRELVDTSMTVELPDGNASSRLFTASASDFPVGTHSVRVTAGDLPPQDVPLRVVRDLDSISLQLGSSEIHVGGSPATICFDGINRDAYVYGFTWSFTLRGEPVSKFWFKPNCLDLGYWFEPVDSIGTLTATATWKDPADNVVHTRTAAFEIPVVE